MSSLSTAHHRERNEGCTRRNRISRASDGLRWHINQVILLEVIIIGAALMAGLAQVTIVSF